jgi:hypothetical protein
MDEKDGWRPAKFFRAIPGKDPIEAWGYEWRGLVLRHTGWATPRTQTRWSLVHIGSGGTIAHFAGNVATVFPVATAIAQCSDFTLFDLPDGWRQTDPDLAQKIAAIFEAHPEAYPDSSFAAPTISDEDARAVIEAREKRDAHD